MVGLRGIAVALKNLARLILTRSLVVPHHTLAIIVASGDIVVLSRRVSVIVDQGEGHSRVVGAPEQWSLAILVTVEQRQQRVGVRGAVGVHRGICRSTDSNRGIRREANQYHRSAERHDIQRTLAAIVRVEDKPAQSGKDKGKKYHNTDILRQAERINRKGVELSTKCHSIGDNHAIDSAKDNERHNKSDSYLDKIILYRAHLKAAEEVYHHKRRNRQQVEQMDTNREAHKVGDKDNPAHSIGAVGLLFPLEHQPYHQRRKHRRKRVYLSLDSREPEGVGKGVCHSAHKA